MGLTIELLQLQSSVSKRYEARNGSGEQMKISSWTFTAVSAVEDN